MNLTRTFRQPGLGLPRPVVIFVAVHLAAVAAIGAAAAWAGADANTASFDAWVFGRPTVANAQTGVTSSDTFAPADAAMPAWLQQSDRRDSQRPWIDLRDGRVLMAR